MDPSQALEIMGEYLAAFLALEQDWSVIDGLMHARSAEEALAHYDTALRAIHRVLETYGGLLCERVRSILSDSSAKLGDSIDNASKIVREEIERDVRKTTLKLVERALAKYPRYRR